MVGQGGRIRQNKKEVFYMWALLLSALAFLYIAGMFSIMESLEKKTDRVCFGLLMAFWVACILYHIVK